MGRVKEYFWDQLQEEDESQEPQCAEDMELEEVAKAEQ